MPLKPLPPALLTAARLRKQAKDLVLEAEALECAYGEVRPYRHVEFKFSKKNMEKRK